MIDMFGGSGVVTANYKGADRYILNDNNEQLIELMRYIENYLDFVGEDMEYSTHRYHDYPATMIPKLLNLFINAVSKFTDIQNVYDPVMGSGAKVYAIIWKLLVLI